MKLLLTFATVLLLSCSHTYYVVRHAEKQAAAPNMSSDVPLSEDGTARAKKIADILASKKIAKVYCTNTIRTKSTAQPTADHFGLPVTTYGPRPDSAFIAQVKAIKKNVLIVGHSNTVDDLVNMLTGEKKLNDLDDAEYNRLFLIKYKGKKVHYEEIKIYPERVREIRN